MAILCFVSFFPCTCVCHINKDYLDLLAYIGTTDSTIAEKPRPLSTVSLSTKHGVSEYHIFVLLAVKVFRKSIRSVEIMNEY